MNILKWFGWERDEVSFDPSRRLFMRRGAAVMLAPVVLPPAISYFFPVHASAIAAPLVGNSFLTPMWVSREALRILQNNLQFVTAANREWDAKFGQVIQVRRPQRFAAGLGY